MTRRPRTALNTGRAIADENPAKERPTAAEAFASERYAVHFWKPPEFLTDLRAEYA